MILGIISLGFGIAWMILHFTADDFQDDRLPSYAYLAMLPEIVCGFMILLSGCLGSRINRKKSCLGISFIATNTFNILVWTPILVVGYAILIIVMTNGAFCGTQPCLPSTWDTYGIEHLLIAGKDWVYLFPAAGVTVGFLDFVISIGAALSYCCLSNKEKMPISDRE